MATCGDSQETETIYQSSKIEEPEEPSHYVVQQQLQDVILAQQAAYEKLKRSVSSIKYCVTVCVSVSHCL